jgi:hypothetical protein
LFAPDQQKKIAESKPVTVRLPDTEATATCIEFFMNVRFDAPGTYWIEILLENQLKLRYPLRATQVAPPS